MTIIQMDVYIWGRRRKEKGKRRSKRKPTGNQNGENLSNKFSWKSRVKRVLGWRG